MPQSKRGCKTVRPSDEAKGSETEWSEDGEDKKFWEELEEEANNEGGEMRIVRVTDMPSEEEVEEHNMTGHGPYRAWCKHCVWRRGKDRVHKEVKEQGELPTVGIDWMWMNKRSGEAELEEEGEEKKRNNRTSKGIQYW